MTWLWMMFYPRLSIRRLVPDGWRGRERIKAAKDGSMLLRVIIACDSSDSVDRRLYIKACLTDDGLLLASISRSSASFLTSWSLLELSLFFAFRDSFLLSLESRLANRLGALSIAATAQVPIRFPQESRR